MRLFLGTFLEPIFLDKIPFKLVGDHLKLKPVKRNYMHLTWLFIGEVEESKLNKLESLIEKRINLFSNLIFKSGNMELWPPGRAPRLVVCAGELFDNLGKDKVDLPIRKFADDLKEVCNPDTKRSFKPHITIARIKKNEYVDKNKALPKIEKFEWQIKEVSLIKSVLSDAGPTYTKMKNWKV